MDQKCFMGFSVSFLGSSPGFSVSYPIRRLLKADVMRMFGSMFEIGVPAIVKGNPRTRPFDSFLNREPDVQRMPESKFGTWPTTMSWTKPPPPRSVGWTVEPCPRYIFSTASVALRWRGASSSYPMVPRSNNYLGHLQHHYH